MQRPIDAEHATHRGGPAGTAGEGERIESARASREDHGQDSEQGSDGKRERRVEQLVLVAEPRQVDRDRQRRDGQRTGDGRSPAGCSPSCRHATA